MELVDLPKPIVSAINKQGCLFCQEKDKEIVRLKQELELLKEVESPQKSKSTTSIEKLGDTEWKIITYSRPDRTSEPVPQIVIIPQKNVTVMWSIIKQKLTDGYCDIHDLKTPIEGTKYSTDYNEVVPYLIKYYEVMENLNLRIGKPNSLRVLGKYYFTHFRMPLLVLQHLNYVYYPKKIYRLKL